MNANDSSTNNAGGWADWFAAAKTQALDLASKAQEMAETASKIAQEKALQIAQQAQELQQNYDISVATSMILGNSNGSVGSPGYTANGEFKLTKEDLSELDMTYVTENVIAMAFPRDRALPGSNEECNDINVVAAYLRKRHQGRFMIWNISEENYDYSKFADQVLEYKFPGHPAPPLGLLFKICTSVESWLDADEKNVAVVHCLTGKGRTATLIACILTWLGEFDSPMQALQYVAQRRSSAVDYLTIPSQRRYLQYFSNMLDGIKPNPQALLLRRVILNSIPALGLSPTGVEGCCPYVQLFKNGRLIATAAPYSDSPSEQSGERLNLRWVSPAEGSVSFSLDSPVQGDLLLRLRHATTAGARVSMFRAAFHTGYISGGVLRLSKAQLDGTASDARYSADFFIDLIFAPITSPGEGPGAGAGEGDNGIMIDSSLADKYEMSLHKDSRFWEGISMRKQRGKKRRARKFTTSLSEQFSITLDDLSLLGGEGEGEVSFYSAPLVPAGGYGNEELLKEIAEVEEEGAVGEKKGSENVSVSTPIRSAPQSELQALEDLERELGIGDMGLFSGEKRPGGGAAGGSAGVVGSVPAPPPPPQESGLEDLDELEKYLQSLSSK